jgi:UDP-glucose 4-epimerase
MSLCLVTGGAGFIGSHLVDGLLAAGHKIRVLDDFSTGNPDNLQGVRKKIELLEGDIARPEVVQKAARGVEIVFHQAALASVPRSVADPLATNQVCVNGTLNVLLAARDAGARRVVYAASSSAYGNSDRLPKRENDPTQPLSPYAVAKLAGEHYCAAFSEVYGLETVRLRYFNVFGPRQPPDSPYAAVIPRFLEAMIAGKRPTIYGDGRQSRDFTYVTDIVQANLLAAKAANVSGKVYNIACGRRTSLLELVDQINALLGTQIKPIHEDARPGDVLHSQADIGPGQTELGYSPKVDMEEGLRNCLDYFRSGRKMPTKV